MTSEERVLCATMARLLGSSSTLGALALLATASAAALLLLGGLVGVSLWLAAFAAAVGILERYFAFRLQFDRGLFEDLATMREIDLATLDEALLLLGLRKQSQHPRALTLRIRGTMRLFYAHGVCVLLQIAALMAIVVSR